MIKTNKNSQTLTSFNHTPISRLTTSDKDKVVYLERKRLINNWKWLKQTKTHKH